MYIYIGFMDNANAYRYRSRRTYRHAIKMPYLRSSRITFEATHLRRHHHHLRYFAVVDDLIHEVRVGIVVSV